MNGLLQPTQHLNPLALRLEAATICVPVKGIALPAVPRIALQKGRELLPHTRLIVTALVLLGRTTGIRATDPAPHRDLQLLSPTFLPSTADCAGHAADAHKPAQPPNGLRRLDETQ